VASLAILAPVSRADRLAQHIDALRDAAGRLSHAVYRGLSARGQAPASSASTASNTSRARRHASTPAGTPA
jgi:hypothetical protein